MMKTARVAVLSGNSMAAGTGVPLLRAFLEHLRLRGWEEGRNLIIDARHADGRADLFAAR
jgi:hypothetical protein